MPFKQRTLDSIAEMICGNYDMNTTFFLYRTGGNLTRFFRDCDTDYVHDGSTRNHWVSGVLKEILEEPQQNAQTPPETFCRVIQTLMDQADACNDPPDRPGALALLNSALAREGFEAFYAEDRQCYLRHIATNTIASAAVNPHRPFSASEQKKREQLLSYLDVASEDEIIQEVLLPLFRQLGFHRITTAGHKDKALEYGKDIWMKFTLPTLHVLYFGIQAKKGKIDSSGTTKAGNANVAEIHNQVLMMLGHEIFDPEIGKRVLVDHAFIVSAGDITKAARNWLGNKLDASKRSQLLFMDRDDIVNLFVVTNMPLPNGALPETPSFEDDSFPF
ncbi:hypothetical protein Gbem_3679 [Citrifermentans bemidjiense Bem]|uniref:Restriction endonuclease n=1 Tax=Citrifermentans bemidjiense (strain ATCC BAA-1014 / DSM 16622 / JCM 12645 / Bem) TaxID=404380 RepID=B5EDP3_CITBB|nr:hypothetical protein [Citrifermentans bemidjiense]ACH40671.1 hypothetical protein Gbem_3679 [Citrifermentans bemidjiense Bem]